MVEINESERIKEKRIKRNEDNLRDLQDNIKRYNIRIIGVPEEEDKFICCECPSLYYCSLLLSKTLMTRSHHLYMIDY